MKVSLLQFSFILAASLVAAAGFAQESQPQVQQTIKDYNVKDNGNKDANFTQVKPKAEHELEWAS